MGELVNCIDVVLAACDGQAYIQQQIESIQHCRGYDSLVARILVLDDGSGDATQNIVNRLAAVDPKISFIVGGMPRLGSTANFYRGLELSTAPYVMLCDQDDVWLPEKIISSLNAVRCRERDRGGNVPVLVYSDLKVVDAKLTVMAESFLAYQGIEANWADRFKHILIQNVAAGCTMLFNRALIDKSCPFPENVIVHDWWMLLVAQAFGEVVHISDPMVLYRQHGANQVGAQKQSYPLSAQFFSLFKRARLNLYHLSLQAESFFQCYGDEEIPQLEGDDWIALHTLIALPQMSIVPRMLTVASGKIRKNNLYRNLGMLCVLLWPLRGNEK